VLALGEFFFEFLSLILYAEVLIPPVASLLFLDDFSLAFRPETGDEILFLRDLAGESSPHSQLVLVPVSPERGEGYPLTMGLTVRGLR
jgi:hypothetical protein